MTRAREKVDLVQSSPTPLWQQMADSLRHRIRSGELKAGSQLPSEPELGVMYGVSRITVRRAIDVLLKGELVVRARGRGTFVATRTLRHDLTGLSGIMDSIQPAEALPTNRIVTCNFITAEPDLAALFGPNHAHLLHVRRIYELKGEPFGVADVYIPCSTELSVGEIDQLSAYGILERHFGLTITRASMTIKASASSSTVAKLLNLDTKATVLGFRRVSYSEDEVPRECTLFWVRPDRYEFSLTVNGPMPITEGLRAAA